VRNSKLSSGREDEEIGVKLNPWRSHRRSRIIRWVALLKIIHCGSITYFYVKAKAMRMP